MPASDESHTPRTGSRSRSPAQEIATAELRGRIREAETGRRRAEVETCSHLEDIRRHRAQVAYGSQQLQGSLARIEELEGQLRETSHALRETENAVRVPRARADQAGLANFRLQPENRDLVSQLSTTTGERNTLRALRTQAERERDLNMAKSQIASHDAQFTELVSRRSADLQARQIRQA
eukprot:7429129-Alexandrium_andersonii.AAC.1